MAWCDAPGEPQLISEGDVNISSERWALLLEYNGSAYAGSQYQPNAFTIQEAIETALDSLNAQRMGRLVCSSRTDAGVHALGQVAHIDMPMGSLDHTRRNWTYAINAQLPSDIAIKQIMLVEPKPPYKQFDATASGRWRWYRYGIYNARNRQVWTPLATTWVKYPLNLERMQQAANYLVGEHDFASFKATNANTTETVCRVIEARFTQEGPVIWFDIMANRFVYHMVRNIMGTLVELGRGAGRFDDCSPHLIADILEAKDRHKAGPRASAQGLTLMAVGYDEPWDFFKNDVYVKTLKKRVQELSSEQNVFGKAS